MGANDMQSQRSQEPLAGLMKAPRLTFAPARLTPHLSPGQAHASPSPWVRLTLTPHLRPGPGCCPESCFFFRWVWGQTY